MAARTTPTKVISFRATADTLAKLDELVRKANEHLPAHRLSKLTPGDLLRRLIEDASAADPAWLKDGSL